MCIGNRKAGEVFSGRLFCFSFEGAGQSFASDLAFPIGEVHSDRVSFAQPLLRRCIFSVASVL